MGIFKTTHKVTEEEKAFQLENLERLKNEFDVTKAMGVKKYPDAMQFIYDKERRCFVVVEGPEETFKLKNPYIIDFDQVKDAYVEVEEFWTEKPGKFEIRPIQNSLMMEDFDKVFWRYNIHMHFETTHPYAKHIEYQMNYKTVITRISGLRLIIMVPRNWTTNCHKYSEHGIIKNERKEQIPCHAEVITQLNSRPKSFLKYLRKRRSLAS